MATLTRFTTPYVGGPTYYTGTGVSGLVPDIFPVAIAGRPYMLDLKSGRFGRAFEQRLRDSADDSNIPGEGAINPQGLWRRGQVSWHKGSAQKYGDTAEGVDTRFSSSKNVDPWTKGQLSLLKTTSEILDSANTNLPMVVVGSYLYVGDGNTLKYTTNLSSWTSVTTGAPTAAIEALTTDGTTVFVSYNNNAIYSSTAGGASVAQYYPTSGSTAYTYNSLKYAKSRIIALHDNHIHLPTGSGGSHTPFYEHPNTSFDFVDSCAGQNAIYVGGNAGLTAIVYKITVKADGTLNVPVVAAELPLGETLSSLTGYLGNVCIGTNKGIRLATADSEADLIVGPLLETTSSVKCAVGDGRFVWYGWTNFDATSTGLGRIDLSQFNSINEPAYASDLMADVQGAVNAVVNWGEYRVFSVSGQGLYREHATNLASTGYVETGSWRWGIPDPKFATFVDFRTLPLTGSLTFALNLDNGGYESLAAFDTQGVTEKTLDGSDTSFGEAAFKITFTRSSTDATNGPTLTRWQVRAFPAPKRSELFSVPVLLHEKLNRSNREYYYDVTNELAFLRGLISDTRITTYQEGEETFRVIVENVEWIPVDSHVKNWIFDGTAVITLRSLTA
jgi:hypothetical protein